MRLLFRTTVSIVIENSKTMKNKKIVIAGGTGFIGQALAARWGKDNQLIILSRLSAAAINGKAAAANNNSYRMPIDGGRAPVDFKAGRPPHRHRNGVAAEKPVGLADKAA